MEVGGVTPHISPLPEPNRLLFAAACHLQCLYCSAPGFEFTGIGFWNWQQSAVKQGTWPPLLLRCPTLPGCPGLLP